MTEFLQITLHTSNQRTNIFTLKLIHKDGDVVLNQRVRRDANITNSIAASLKLHRRKNKLGTINHSY